MPNAYDSEAAAAAFDKFLASEDGQIQQEVLWKNIEPYLGKSEGRILDAGCGQGWLSAKLIELYPNTEAFDASVALIDIAKRNHPQINFQVADVTETIPYQDSSFDIVILNMAAHDLSNLAKGLHNLNRVLAPGGKFIMTIANPYYSFPVGVWKRGVIGRLLNKFPRLQLRPYHFFARQKNQLHAWSGELSSYFYPLSEYIDQALASGFKLQVFRDVESPTDSNKYDAHYRLYRWPMILLLVFEKSSK